MHIIASQQTSGISGSLLKFKNLSLSCDSEPFHCRLLLAGEKIEGLARDGSHRYEILNPEKQFYHQKVTILRNNARKPKNFRNFLWETRERFAEVQRRSGDSVKVFQLVGHGYSVVGAV
jgi:hypothetical protein